MKLLLLLIQSLTKSERRIILASLKLFSNHNKDTLTAKLFNTLAKTKKVLTEQEYAAMFYPNGSKAAFKMLKSRLKAKILDTLNNDKNINRRGILDPLDHSTVKIRKKLSQLFFLYYSKGNNPILKNLVNEIIRTSKKYESYTPLLEALKLKKTSKLFTKTERDFEKICKQIAHYEHCNFTVNLAIDYYYRLIIRTDFYAKLNHSQMQSYLLSAAGDIQKHNERAGSIVATYYTKLIQMAYYQNEQDYQNARKSCIELLKIIIQNHSVYKKSRLGIVYVNLCHFEIFLGEYRKSLEYASMVYKYISESTDNYLSVKEQEFYAFFYLKCFSDAEQVLNILMSRLPDNSADFRLSKYQYYNANISFVKGDYRTALKILSGSFNVAKDKQGWNTWIRILSVLCLLEMERFDEAATHIQSLLKHMERHSEQKHEEREKIIVKALRSLEYLGFDYAAVREKDYKYLALLHSDKKQYCWKPLGPELIIFHKWLQKRYLGSRISKSIRDRIDKLKQI